jgi:hypothetical protein
MIMSAARLGEIFHTDPIEILNCDEITWVIRMACGKVIGRDREEQANKMKQGR